MSIQHIPGGGGQQPAHTPTTAATTTTGAQAQIPSSNPVQPGGATSIPPRTAVVPTAGNSSSRTTGAVRHPLSQLQEPTNSQHLALMRTPGVANLIGARRTEIKKLLIHLERNNMRWATLSSDIAALENVVNSGIRQGLLGSGTRSAIRTAFGLSVRPEPRQIQTPALREHRDLLQSVGQSGVDSDEKFVKRFLLHLESQGLAWSVISSIPSVLEAEVNGAITRGALHAGTRAALNRSCGQTLRGPTGYMRLAPFVPEHQSLLTQARNAVRQSEHSMVNRFLCFLEQNNLTWSSLLANRPLLEAVVTIAIAEGGLHAGTRSALNLAFNLDMRAPRDRGA